MLDIMSGTVAQDCAGILRRDFLRAGSLGFGGLTLPWLQQMSAAAQESGSTSFIRKRSVVMLYLSGGASHIETFNPNMDGPLPSRSTTGEVTTRMPGVTFGGTFPMLAQCAQHMSVVRSFQHPVGGHVQAIVHLLTGGTDPLGQGRDGYSMGSMFSRLRGSNHPDTGLPTFALLNSEEVDPQYRSERGRVEKASQPGSLGAPFAAFQPGARGPATQNMQLTIDSQRLDNRRALLTRLDELKRQAEHLPMADAGDNLTQQAFDVILGNAAEVFDLTREDTRTLQRYDTSHMRVGKKIFRPSQLGRHMLTARRLIEAGCGFVNVHSAGWDMHADTNNPGIVSGMEMLGRPVDRAVSAFLEDLEQRGMLDDVLLVITGDFGRTPRVNSKGGRDHWPKLCTLAFAGGGICQGQVIGQSTRGNDAPASEPIQTGHMLSTIMNWLFDIGQLRLVRGVPRDVQAHLEAHAPIPGLTS